MFNIFVDKLSILNYNTDNHNKYNRKIKKIQWLRRWRNAETNKYGNKDTFRSAYL